MRCGNKRGWLRLAEYGWVECRGALYPSGLPDLDYALNPYVGCEHGCKYCYSKAVFRSRRLAEGWGAFVWAKRRLLDRLRADLKRKPKGMIGVGTVTDPYQPLEAKLKLTSEALRLIAAYGFKASIQTKSPLILRDGKALVRGRFDVGITLTSLNERIASLIEPRAPPPRARLEALRKLSSLGVETWLFYGPIIPEVNDDPETVSRIVEAAVSTGCRLILYDKLNLKRWVFEFLAPTLEELKSGLAGRVRETLNSKAYREKVSTLIQKACSRVGVKCEPAFPAPRGFKAPGERPRENLLAWVSREKLK